MSTDEGTAVSPDRTSSPPAAPVAPTPSAGPRDRGSRSRTGTRAGARAASSRRPTRASSNDPAAEQAAQTAQTGQTGQTGQRWWARDHPVFVPLSSFFAGMLLVVFTFGLLGAIVSQVLGYAAAGTVFPYFIVVFVVPLVLIGFRATRRPGLYLLLGMVLTSLVVVGVAALTLWLLLSGDG